ncbi:MAG: dihydroorotase [Candidatus Muiribacteriota bacterium]
MMKNKVVYKNAFYFENSTGKIKKNDIYVKNGIIEKIDKSIQTENLNLIQKLNGVLFPGFADLHVHFREPGFSHKETIKTGVEAAISGGIHTVLMMPNTKPAPDSLYTVELFNKYRKQLNYPGLLYCGPITKGREGRELADFNFYKNHNIKFISDDGDGVYNDELALKAFEKAAELDLTISSHCQSRKYNVNQSEAEIVMVKRDINLAKKTGAKLHIQHISTEKTLNFIREAKSSDINVTCEVCPHHLFLSSNIKDYGKNTNLKMNPPLRCEKDCWALINGLKDGSIDVVSSDHAPHTYKEKQVCWENAPFGVSGIEIMAPLIFYELYKKRDFPLKKIVSLLCNNPLKILGLENISEIKEGAAFTFNLINLDKIEKVDIGKFKSKGRNTPFNGYSIIPVVNL